MNPIALQRADFDYLRSVTRQSRLAIAVESVVLFVSTHRQSRPQLLS